MLARKFMLKDRSDFDLIKKKGKSLNSESFILRYYYDKNAPVSKFGFIVTTKVSKKASLRNKAKRALSEGVRRSIFAVKKGYLCLIIAKPVIIKKYTPEIMKEIDETLKKANLFIANNA